MSVPPPVRGRAAAEISSILAGLPADKICSVEAWAERWSRMISERQLSEAWERNIEGQALMSRLRENSGLLP